MKTGNKAMEIPIVLILDAHFGKKIFDIDWKIPLWIISSIENDKAIDFARKSEPRRDITNILKKENEDFSYLFYRSIIDIDDHYSYAYNSCKYICINVYGFNQNIDKKFLSELSLFIDEESNGFITLRKSKM